MEPASTSDPHSQPERADDDLTVLRASIRRVTHDISNPLGIIRMASYALQMMPEDAQKRVEYLTLISTSIDRVEANLKELRALAAGRVTGPPANNEKHREP